MLLKGIIKLSWILLSVLLLTFCIDKDMEQVYVLVFLVSIIQKSKKKK